MRTGPRVSSHDESEAIAIQAFALRDAIRELLIGGQTHHEAVTLPPLRATVAECYAFPGVDLRGWLRAAA